MNLLEVALFLHSEGICVVPAHPREKRPSVDWKKYQKKRPTRDKLMEWFDGVTLEETNIGIICGGISNNLVIFDFDDRSAYDELGIKIFENKRLVIETGSGKRHLWVRSKKRVKSFKIPEIKLEIRSDGNFTVIPPSIHPSGNPYKFIGGLRPILEVYDAKDTAWNMAKRLGVKRPRYSSGKSDIKIAKIRPCIRAMIDNLNPGAVGRTGHGLSHAARRAITSEGFALGMDDEQVAGLFANQPDFDFGQSIYQVRSLRMTWLGKPYGCAKLRENGWCEGIECDRTK